MSKDITGHYDNYFKGWDTKKLGPKPTAKDLDTIHKLGARPGKQALANAMSLRPCGVTGAQIVIACGAPQLNKMRGFVQDGLLKREAVPPSAENHTVYKMTLTSKGATRIKGAVKAKDEPKAKEKAPKAPAKKRPSKKPVVQAPPAIVEPVQEVAISA